MTTAPPDARAAMDAAADAVPSAPSRHRPGIHRLRDLDGRGRLVAALLAAALLVAPALALTWVLPEWSPSNDPALMALRARDVGTSRTPLLGQPSTSAHYVEAEEHVHHLGPIHLYLLAGPVRAAGAAVGMLTVSFAIVSASLLVAAWTTFRLLGPRGGVTAVVALGAVTFTTGASTLVNPVSSNIAGYPLLCSVVLLWAIACGDVRLLPLPTVVVSFTAQQHLSVVSAVGLVAVVALAVCAFVLVRRCGWRGAARHARAWTLASVAVGLVLWSPVLVQQVTGRPGNLSALAEFARADERPTLGWGKAARQLAHTLGMPPLLGRTDLEGADLLAPVPARTWATAALVVVVLGTLAVAWRRRHPRRSLLVATAGATALAGLVTGASVPTGLESNRLALYHWVWALSFLVAVAGGLAAVSAVSRTRLGRTPGVPAVAVVLALVAVVVPAAVNPRLDRFSNTMPAAYSALDRTHLDDLADQVVAAAAADDRPLLLTRGSIDFSGPGEALAVALEERGLTVSHPRWLRGFVHGERLVDPAAVASGLVLVVDGPRSPTEDPPGTLVAEVDLAPGLDRAAYEQLVDQASDVERVVLGPEASAAFDALPPGTAERVLSGEQSDPRDVQRLFTVLDDEAGRQLVLAAALHGLASSPRAALLDPDVLAFVRDHPLAAPQLDARLVDRVLDTLPPDRRLEEPLALRVHRVDRPALLAIARDDEL